MEKTLIIFLRYNVLAVTVDMLQACTCYHFNIMTCKSNNANNCRILLAGSKKLTTFFE